MSLSPGTRLGPYEILAPLGAGGMGQVYKARDTRLGRSVAIKVVSEEFSNRFEREARAISGLNHPHICTLYDVGPGYLVMELVEGETLAARLRRDRLPMDAVLRYGAEIADALVEAHASGIVHRDLKPANLMVTRSGIKVLDFGLARIVQPDETVTANAIQGTPAYMAPEQREGQTCDARTDIYALGLVLYEMAAGKRLKQGETAILDDFPERFTHVIERCLENEPDNRWQSARDVKAELEWAGKRPPAKVQPDEPLHPARRWLWPLAFAGLLIAGTGFIWWWNRAPAAPQEPVLTQLTRDPGLTGYPALSPDGRLLAYASDRETQSGVDGNLDIWVQQLAGGEPIRLTRDPADDSEPSFSGDGARIAFRSERNGGGVYVISSLGGEEKLIAPGGRRPRFSPDGQWVAYWTGTLITRHEPARGTMFLVPASGGQPRRIQPGFPDASLPVWSPNGQRILFDASSQYGGRGNWWITPLDGPAVQVVTRDSFMPWGLASPIPVAWLTEPDRILFVAGRGDSYNVWQAPISPKTGKITEPPQRLTFGTGQEVQPSMARGPDGSLRLVFAATSLDRKIWSLPIDANQGRAAGEALRLTGGVGLEGRPELSADGKRLFYASNRTGNNDIWVKDLTNGRETNLTNTPFGENAPVSNADGSQLAYAANNPIQAIYIMAVGRGPGDEPQPGLARKISLSDKEACAWSWSWSSDSKRLLYTCPQSGPVWMFNSESGETTQVLGQGIFEVYFSPDNRWIVFDKVASDGGTQQFIAPFDGRTQPPEKDWIAVTDDSGGEPAGWPRWSPDGNLVYFISGRDGFRCIWARRLDPATKRPSGPPFAMYHSHSSRRSLLNVPGYPMALSITRHRIAFTVGETTANIWMATWEGRK